MPDEFPQGDNYDIDLIYEDDHLVVINKPHGLMVHRSPLSRNTDRFAVQEVRNIVGCHVYPAHRLDRKTSGILLFTKNKKSNQFAQEQFRNREVLKTYYALVRGYILKETVIDYPLVHDEKKQSAITRVKPVRQFEIGLPSFKHASSRYTLVRLMPETGRFHQLRKHMAHVHHPIIGDRPHGCNKENRIWKTERGLDQMLLHAEKLEIVHPFSKEQLSFEAEFSPQFKNAIRLLENHLI